MYPSEHGGGHGHSSHHETGRSNPRQILNMLAQSSNEFAAGIAMIVKALADANASPPASPIMVDYRGTRMAFGRRNLGRLNGWVRGAVLSLRTTLLTPGMDRTRFALSFR